MDNPIPNKQCDACARDGVQTESTATGNIADWLRMTAPVPGNAVVSTTVVQHRVGTALISEPVTPVVDICPDCKVKHTLASLVEHLKKPVTKVLVPKVVADVAASPVAAIVIPDHGGFPVAK